MKKAMINKINGLVVKGYMKVKKSIDNETGGWGIIASIIVGAIIFLALIALNSPVSTFFSSTWTQFTTWVTGKLTTLFS